MVSRFAGFSAVALAGAMLLSTPARASTVPLFSEDFDDVTRSAISTKFLTRLNVRTVTNIVSSSPGQLPAGTIALGESAASNVRAASNIINKDFQPAVNDVDTFDGFFTSQFLVIGDDQSKIGDPPGGGDSGVLFPIALPRNSSSGSLRIQFDFAFDGKYQTDGGNDFFNALLFRGNDFGGNNHSLFSAPTLLSLHISDNLNKRSGHFDTVLDISKLPTGNSQLYLAFILREVDACDCTNTAVGIDNVQIDPVPVPAALWLFGPAMTGLLGFRRRAG